MVNDIIEILKTDLVWYPDLFNGNLFFFFSFRVWSYVCFSVFLEFLYDSEFTI